MTKIQVPRASVHEHKVEVGTPDSDPTTTTTYLITWEFHTEKHNIDFEVFFTPQRSSGSSSPAQETIVPKKRVESSQRMIEGGFETTRPGIVTFIWDNYFSWTQGKTVSYRIDVVGKIALPVDEKKGSGGESEIENTITTIPTGSSSSTSTTTITTTSTTIPTEVVVVQAQQQSQQQAQQPSKINLKIPKEKIVEV